MNITPEILEKLMAMVQLRSGSKITIPAQLRSKYKFQEGDVYNILDLEDGSFLLKPGISEMDKLSATIEKSWEEEGAHSKNYLKHRQTCGRNCFKSVMRILRSLQAITTLPDDPKVAERAGIKIGMPDDVLAWVRENL